MSSLLSPNLSSSAMASTLASTLKTAPVRMLDSPASIGAEALEAAGGGEQTEFSAILEEAVSRVENYRAEADRAVDRFLRGEDQEVHKVALAVQESEIAMELFLQAKNKVVQAYQEVMRMQL